jgi:membrane fusion protein (multidrug efflux system)
MTSMPTVEPDLAVPVNTPKPLLKRLLLPTLGIAALVLAGMYAAHWWTAGRFIEETDDAYIGADVTVIGPKVAGYIDQVLVTDNQQVKAGDVLVRLDSRDYRANLAKAEGAVAAEEALLANLDATEQLQQAVIGQARAGIDAAGAETARSRDDDARYKKLVSTNAVSVESAQRANATFKTAQAQSNRAQAELLAAQRQLNVIATQKQQARAALIQARAERDLAQLNVGYTELRAPVDGVIGNRRARVGAYAQAGSQLLSVVPTSGLWVAHGAGAASNHSRRRAFGPGIPWSSGQPGTGQRFAIQRAATGKCHRQLHQDRPAGTGAHPSRPGRQRARPPAPRPVGHRRSGHPQGA